MEIQNSVKSRNAFPVREGQSLFDLAVQTCGSVESIFDLAVRNLICITDTLIPGQIVKLPDVGNKGIVNYYTIGDIIPASDTDVMAGNRTFDDTFDLTFR